MLNGLIFSQYLDNNITKIFVCFYVTVMNQEEISLTDGGHSRAAAALMSGCFPTL